METYDCPLHGIIALRAYEMYEKRRQNGLPGDALSDRLSAERETLRFLTPSRF